MYTLAGFALRCRRNRQCFACVIALLLISFSAPNASAVLIVTTNGTALVRFDSASPGAPSAVAISGMQSGETLIGIDFRPATGELYGIGATNRVYRLDYTTGVATQIGAQAGFNISGTAFGMDINPLVDRIRLVSNTEQNLRINPNDATLTAADSPLNPAGNVVAAAYTNNFAGAPNTTLYGIDSASGQLVRIGGPNGTPSPNGGQITVVGSLNLGTNLNESIGFDIAPTGVAYAAITTSNLSRFYTINLETGAATLVGSIGNGSTPYRSLAVGPSVFINSAQILLPAAPNSTGVANPYPSTINVSGLTGRVVKLAVRINNFQHTRPNHIDMLLVAPSGEKMVFWSDVGGSTSTCSGGCNNTNFSSSGVTITVDDAAVNSLPTGVSPPLANGHFKPANIDPTGADFFAAPAPSPPYSHPAPVGNATLASTFNGINPNGTWSLYVSDDETGETGRISEGWGLEITDAPCTLTCRADIPVVASPGQCGRSVAYFPSETSGPCGEVTYSMPSGSFFPVGTTAVNVSTASGSQCTFNVTVTDGQAPAITCNSDITVQAPAGQNSAVVEYPPALVADNCAGATTVYDPPSGSSFPIGTTTVIGTSTDASGNTMMCTFKVTVTAGGGGDPQPPMSTKLANIATRLRVEQGENVLIGGFIITGADPKRLMLRAIGPSLPIADRLLDPNLELYNSGGDLVAANNNWKEAPNQQEIFDTSIAPSDDFESAVLLNNVSPGAYTAIVSGANGGTGVGLVEAYDLSLNANAKLGNIATRGSVKAGDNVMIGGFIVVGPNSQNLLVRAIGTSLPIENKLADPQLQLVDSNGDLVADNDNWRSNQEGEIAATGIPPTDDAESAVLVNVQPAAYTAIVRGANNGTGVGLVEVYALD